MALNFIQYLTHIQLIWFVFSAVEYINMLSALKSKLVRALDDHEQHQESYAACCLAVHRQAECSEEVRHSLLWL